MGPCVWPSQSVRKEVAGCVEQRMKEKCLRVLAWHRGDMDAGMAATVNHEIHVALN